MLGSSTIRIACQDDFDDIRERSWDDEVNSLLDEYYQDWRSPSNTYMVPCEFSYRQREPDAGEHTEKKFYDLLQKFGESRSESMFVIHSYNFAEMISEWNQRLNQLEKKWLTGEHDFVIIHHQHGILFFQVNRQH